MNFVVLPFALYFITVLYFDLIRNYKFSIIQKFKVHPVYKYWTFCYQCVSFWLAIPLLLLLNTLIGNVIIMALSISGIAYILFYMFDFLSKEY